MARECSDSVARSSRAPARRLVAESVGEGGQQRGRDRGLEVAVREAGQAVLVGDRLALLGQLEAPGRMPGRLGEDGRVRRTAAATGAAAAAVEDRELHVALGGQLGERLLGAVVLPGRRQVAAVLARVGVAEHHLEPPAAALDECAEALVVEQRRARSRRRLPQVGDRLEQRHEREVMRRPPPAPGRARAAGRPGPRCPTR